MKHDLFDVFCWCGVMAAPFIALWVFGAFLHAV